MDEDGIEISDEMIGAASVIQEVIQEEMREGAPAEVIPFIPPRFNTEQDERIAAQLVKMIHIIGDRIKDDQDFRDAIDNVGTWERFRDVARNVLQNGFTWERIILLYYVACRLAIRFVIDIRRRFVENCANLLRWTLNQGRWILELDNSLFVSVILRSTLSFLCTKLLTWIHERSSERQDCVHVNQLATRILIVCETLKNDQAFQAGIGALAQVPGSRLGNFNQVAQNALDQEMNWEMIAVLNYVFGVMAIQDNWSVRDIMRWLMNLFHPNRLRLAQESRRQIAASRSSLILIFVTGVALGSFITWRATRSL